MTKNRAKSRVVRTIMEQYDCSYSTALHIANEQEDMRRRLEEVEQDDSEEAT